MTRRDPFRPGDPLRPDRRRAKKVRNFLPARRHRIDPVRCASGKVDRRGPFQGRKLACGHSCNHRPGGHLASTAPDAQSFERVLRSRLAEVGVRGENDAASG